jgi:hypothetical protein
VKDFSGSVACSIGKNKHLQVKPMKLIFPATLQVTPQADVDRLLLKQAQARLWMLRNPMARANNVRVQAYFNRRLKDRKNVLRFE